MVFVERPEKIDFLSPIWKFVIEIMAIGFSREAQQSMIWKFASKIMAEMVFVERPEKIADLLGH